MTDRELTVLALRACDGDEVAFTGLCRELNRMMRGIVSAYYTAWLDRDDLMQEARVGLHRATVNFDPSRGIPFRAFASLAVERAVITAVKYADREKHRPVNGSVELDGMLADRLPDDAADPHRALMAKETLAALITATGGLSVLERHCLQARLNGWPVASMTGQLKQADNALQRAHRKLAAAAAA